uniref:Omega-3 desaturase-like 2 n=1 Tax=Adineta vaga TaxID=104782 RepID=A0A2H4NNK9_ADIVA|nr:omega-3 desaturase-like 2 [Adineta vaga]
MCETAMKQDEYTTRRFTSHDQQQELDVDLLTPYSQLPNLSDIKIKIPAHCFRSTVRKSMFYVTLDIFIILASYIVMIQLEHKLKYGILFFLFTGTLYMALFSIGHDCTHASFSNYSLLNDTIGTIVFTWILIPYFPWKLTHKNHHKNTGNMEKDEAFCPQRDGIYEESIMNDFFLWTPGLSWFHYLVNGYAPRYVSHFNPFEIIFEKHIIKISISLGVYVTMLYLMFLYAIHVGIISLIVHHLIPVFVFATYFVVVTLLHHTEMDVPWFVNSEWNYIKGQLSTVDRHYGHVHGIIHSIGTHQIHHLFPKVPHYNLEEATFHFRKAFPNLVRFNNDRILSSFVRMGKKFIRQRFIGKDISVFTYSNDQDDK